MPRQRRSTIAADIQAIRSSLSTINNALGRLIPALAGAPLATAGRAVARPARHVTLSPRRRAALKLQGQYMGYMRNLKPRAKARVKALRVGKGIEAAIKLARRLAR